ncbi:MAG TPA: zinc ribbon domain-containing protein, partial [Stenomitos sp.]
QHPPNEPTRLPGPNAASQVVVHCPQCGGKTRGAARYCAHCGESLLRPDESTCLGCGEPLEVSAAPHCAACGAYVPTRLRPSRPLPRRSRLARLAIAVAAAGGLWLMGQAGSQWFGLNGGAPSLAGVHVGDAQTSVERKLGKPERRDTEVFWNGPDGAAHRVNLWQYGVTREGDSSVADLTVTFLDGKVYQVGVLEKGFKTSEGLAVGDRVGKAHRLYGTAIEEDMVAGLQPMKFLKGGVVVKIVTMPGDDHLLAIGIESPQNLPLDSAHAGSTGSSDSKGGSRSLGDDIPSQPI